MNNLLNSNNSGSRLDLNNINLFSKSKRSQHEMVGFILIVIIVVIAGLFLLFFYITADNQEKQSKDLQNFLESSMKYTTDCAINYEPQYDNLKDLIKSCYNNEMCENGEMACFMLNSTLSRILDKTWKVSSQSTISYYSIIIYYQEDKNSQKDRIIQLQKGNCTRMLVGAEYLIPQYPGNIIINMEICYNN
jgi:hypothetical protein